MKTVYVYGFTGKYNGKPEYEYKKPELHAVHKCMLFLSQNNNQLSFEEAIKEISYFGFEEIENLSG